MPGPPPRWRGLRPSCATRARRSTGCSPRTRTRPSDPRKGRGSRPAPPPFPSSVDRVLRAEDAVRVQLGPDLGQPLVDACRVEGAALDGALCEVEVRAP